MNFALREDTYLTYLSCDYNSENAQFLIIQTLPFLIMSLYSNALLQIHQQFYQNATCM